MPGWKPGSIRWISTAQDLQILVKELSMQPRLAVDTESNSLYAYRERICLIQFSTPVADYLIDPLALSDLSALASLFSEPDHEKVFHAAEYDILCLRRDYGFNFVKIFDTMQAARILGYQKTGLDFFLQEHFAVQVNKHFQKADWTQRPLPEELLEYAATDTHYLLQLRDILQSELMEMDRWVLAQEEFNRTARQVQNETGTFPWQRISGSDTLSDKQRAVLRELTIWRENQARYMDRPVFKVLSDRILLALAQSQPQNVEHLIEIGLTRRQRELFGPGLLKAVKRGVDASPLRRAVRSRPSEAYIRRLESLRSWRKNTARLMNVESDVILPRIILYEIVKHNPQNIESLRELMPDSPWRIQRFGEQILAEIKQKG